MSTVDLIEASLTNDEGGKHTLYNKFFQLMNGFAAFWRVDKLRKLISTLITQVKVCPSLGLNETRATLKNCLGAIVAIVDDDTSLKNLNLELLMQTRSDDAQVRLYALQCAEHLWSEHSDKLSGIVSDVVTFIAESADDEHDQVAKAARGLKKIIEKRCGGLDVLMQ